MNDFKTDLAQARRTPIPHTFSVWNPDSRYAGMLAAGTAGPSRPYVPKPHDDPITLAPYTVEGAKDAYVRGRLDFEQFEAEIDYIIQGSAVEAKRK